MLSLMLLVAAATSAEPVPTPRAVVTAMFAAFDRHDAEAIAKLYAPDARLTSSDFCAVRGRGDVARTYAALFAAYPDIRDRIEVMIVEGDRVAVRFVATSRSGALAMPVQAMIRVRDGRIVEDDAIFDTGGEPCQP